MRPPKEYVVKFTFQEATQIEPPYINVIDVAFNYPAGPALFKKV